uniref:VWFA domain-containing protein n=2 Tax=Eptatretus burgeri TaxID=7764 RepID=A0A8C4QM44_EPTBU
MKQKCNQRNILLCLFSFLTMLGVVFSLQTLYRMARNFSKDNWLVVYREGGKRLDIVEVEKGNVRSVFLPFPVAAVFLTSTNRWLLIQNGSNRKYSLDWADSESDKSLASCWLQPLHEEALSVGFGLSTAPDGCIPGGISAMPISSETLSLALQQSQTMPTHLLDQPSSFATAILGYPETKPPYQVQIWPRETSLPFRNQSFCSPVAFLPSCGQIVRALPAKQVPLDLFHSQGEKSMHYSGYLEVTDLGTQTVKYIGVPNPAEDHPYSGWLARLSEAGFLLAEMEDGTGVITVDTDGRVRTWETETISLQRSLSEWRTMAGAADDRPLQVTVQKDGAGGDVSGPKHGRRDPLNTPHIGGNTWAGGTGGRDTAGLGGIGGPYRLDAGHPVHQVGDADKAAVPEHVRQAAKEMAQKALKDRLRDIGMSPHDAQLYDRFSSAIRPQVQALRLILDGLQARGQERQWLRLQTDGELDEGRLVDGLLGEKAVFRRRGDKPPEPGSPPQQPKRVRLVADVSGSMYRFNGLDGRLERCLQSALLLMEAFHGYGDRIVYDICGHSGDSCDIELVSRNRIPSNDKERLDVLNTMYAHSQFCSSGDSTLPALHHAMSALAHESEHWDERLVLLLSDANLARYGVPPEALANALTAEPTVYAAVLFLGSLGDQAQRLKRVLPAGQSYIAMDTKHIPGILQEIFSSAMLAS